MWGSFLNVFINSPRLWGLPEAARQYNHTPTVSQDLKFPKYKPLSYTDIQKHSLYLKLPDGVTDL